MSLIEQARAAVGAGVAAFRPVPMVEDPRRCQESPIRAAVALGGGGARGLAHLGVMEAIGESGVQTERIVGVSIGSLMGGLCAVDSDIERVQATAVGLLDSPVFSQKCRRMMGSASRVGPASASQIPPTGPADWFGQLFGRLERIMRHGHRLTRIVSSPGILSSEILAEAVETLIPDIDISEAEIPLSIVAADLVSGHRVVLEQGPLRQAVLGSMAIPGFFPPVAWQGGMLLSDIGVLDAIPLAVARSYDLDLTIGVDVGSTVQRLESFTNTIDVMMRMEEIGERICRKHSLGEADLLIRPDVGHRPWYDFREPGKLIREGAASARRELGRVNGRIRS